MPVELGRFAVYGYLTGVTYYFSKKAYVIATEAAAAVLQYSIQWNVDLTEKLVSL